MKTDLPKAPSDAEEPKVPSNVEGPENKTLSISEAANYLGVHPETLRRWEATGALPSAFRTSGNQRRYSISDLEKFKLARKTGQPEAAASLSPGNLEPPAVSSAIPSNVGGLPLASRDKNDLILSKIAELTRLNEEIKAAVSPASPSEPLVEGPLDNQSPIPSSSHRHRSLLIETVFLSLLALLFIGTSAFAFFSPAEFGKNVLNPAASYILSAGANAQGTMRFLGSVFFGNSDNYFISPVGDASLHSLTASSLTANQLTTNSLKTSSLTTNSLTTDYLTVTRSETIAGLNAQFLNSLSSSEFLRSDTSNTFTQGTLTFASGTTLALAGGSSLAVSGSLSLPSGSITTPFLADSSITSAKIADGTITGVDISPSAAIAYSKLNLSGSIVGSDLASNIAISTTGAISSSSSLSATGGGTIASSGLLTASNGFTLSSGTLTLPSGSVADSFLTSNVALLNNAQTFTGAKTFSAPLTASGGITDSGNFSQTGAGTFGTGTGAISLNGNTTLASGKTFTWTTGSIDTSGNLGVGTTSPGAKVEVDPGSTTQIGQIIKAQSSQTADLLQIRDSLNNVIAKVDNLGNLTANTLTSLGNVSGTTLTSTASTGTAPLTVASTTQVANLNSNYVGGLTAGQLGATVMPNLVPNSDFSRRNKWMTFMPETFVDTSGWTAGVGVVGTVTGNIYTAGQTGNGLIFAGLPVWRDVRMSAQFKAVDTGVVYYGVVKYVNNTNFVAARWNNGNFELFKEVATVSTTVATVAQTLTLNNWYWVELEAQGTKYIAKLYSSGVSPVAKSSATLLQTLSGDITDSAVVAGNIALWSNASVASQWGGLSTGDGGVYVEGWGPESVSPVYQGILGGQAIGFDESTDAGPLGKQSALRTYIPAASRGIELDIPSTGAGGAPSTIKPSTAYTLSTYEKVSGLGGSGSILWGYIREQASDGSATAYSAAINDGGETSYTRKTATATTTSTTRMHFVTLGVNYDRQAGSVKSATGTLFIDLSQLEEGSVATPWRNAPADDGPIVWKIHILDNLLTTSTSLVEIDSRNLAGNFFLPWDGIVRANLSGQFFNTIAGNFNVLAVTVDGSNITGDTANAYFREPVAGNELFITTDDVANAAAGKHRFASLWRTNANTLQTTVGGVARFATLVVTATRGKFDFAEEYTVDDTTIGAGDVVQLASNNSQVANSTIEKSAKGYNPSVLGIVSTAPGITLGSTVELNNYQNKPNLRPLALSGRVPVKVTTENGSIQRGDFLTSSATMPGYAMKATKAGRTIGIALEELRCDKQEEISNTTDKVRPCQGKILVFVNLSWFDPQAYISDSGEYVIAKKEVISDKQEATSGDTGSNKHEGSAGTASSSQPVANQPAGSSSSASSPAPSSAPTYQVKNPTTQEVIERIGAYNSLFVANLTVGKLDASEITVGGKSLGELIEQAISQQPAVSSGETVAVKDGQLTLTKVTADSGVFGTITSTIEAMFETLTAKTAQIAEATIDKLTVKKVNIDGPAVGQAVILAGESQTLITNSLVTNNSKVFITFRDPYSPATRYWISEIKAGESFTVTLDQPVSADAHFDWWIIN